MMKKIAAKMVWAALINCTCRLSATAQRKSFDIGLEVGPYFTAVDKPILGSGYVGGGFDYHATDRLSIASNLVLAKYYFQNYELDYFSKVEIPVERQASQLQSCFSLNYRIFQYKRIQFQAGASAAVIVSGKQQRVDTGNGGYYISFISNTDWGFPLAVEAYIPVFSNFFIGINYGVFIQPDYPVMARQLGLKLSYRI